MADVLPGVATAREAVIKALNQPGGASFEKEVVTGLVAIAWALLDLADAVREGIPNP